MKLSLFDYNLPKRLIANKPANPRDSSRLLVYNRQSDKITHDKFLNLPKYLKKGDILVFNDSKVMPARLLGHKPTGGAAEALLLKKINKNEWEAQVGCRKPKIGLKLLFPAGLRAELAEQLSDKTWRLKFNFSGKNLDKRINRVGQVSLPPYIKNPIKNQSRLKKQYQTVFAKNPGSAAAPTAGLHFTERLLKKLYKKGVQTEYITLHVGLGTFEPVNTQNIKDYQIHEERLSIDKKTVARLLKAKKQGKRIIAVGTTSVRALESLFDQKIKVKDYNFSTDIFIYPGYKFKFVDAVITNFHLPKSSLLMLVSAFVGRQKTLKIYQKAARLKYRFYSFGDAMFLQ